MGGSSMYFSCLYCKEVKSERLIPFLCNQCSHHLEMLEPFGSLCSLYRYNSFLREIILSAKVHGNYRAVICLSYLFTQSPLTQSFVKNSYKIVPAPSSLWSRLRGRTDLAWFLAQSLARSRSCKLMPAPVSLQWQFHKRAKIRRRKRINLSFFESVGDERAKKILVVDDVITSGHTLMRTSSLYRKEDCLFLTLASARDMKNSLSSR